ncbi:hypothetical protein EAF04_009866 [Stromatinia cepivora]|nr:hypothetical protein EAF04_009866 [Stromatinia cepivora]
MAMGPQDIVNLLTKYPPADQPIPYQIGSGTMTLFQGDFNSTATSIALDDYAPDRRHVIPSPQYQQTTYILFNFPVGTVVTILSNIKPNEGNIADLKDCGTCADLVGTGKTESVNMIPIGMNDHGSMFFWRTVDLSFGAIEMWDGGDGTIFTGRRATIFLSEWAPGVVHSLDGWQLNNTASSLCWKSLLDRQTATLYDSSDGTGQTYSNIKGWGSIKEIPLLGGVQFNDRPSAFRWDSVNPVKEIIEPFTIVASNASNDGGLTSVSSGTNDSSESQSIDVSLTNSTAQTVTVETSDQHVVGISTTFQQTATEGVEGIASSQTQWSVSASYSYTHTSTESRSETKTLQLVVSQGVRVPPHCRYTATLLVVLGRLPPTEYHTTAQRWYRDPITGSNPDPQNNGWYKRTEDVRLTMTGTLACRNQVTMKADPL